MKNINHKIKILSGVALVGAFTGVLFTNCSKSGFTAQDIVGVDTFLDYAWYIHNTGQKVFAKEGGTAGNDLNLSSTWSQGIAGQGIKILISDDGVENTHEDLKANFLLGVSKDYTRDYPYTADTAAPLASDDNHGTAVAGLVAAAANNGVGIRGVAFESSIASANFLSSSVKQTEAALIDQASGDYDVFSMSWGSSQNTLVAPVPSFQDQLKSGATSGRNGKGSVYIKSAGNDFMVYCNGSSSEICVGNANFDSDNSTPYTILTAALNAKGEAASYSSVGSNVWISSFGGEFGDDSPAMISTDRSGCAKGFSTSSSTSKVSFDKGSSGNTNCNYTATFNGTSAAAPVMSGVVALLLQANPNLTWRDVKYILAKTAVPLHYTLTGSISHPNDSVPTGYKWEQVWIENAAGFKFHNWYGFGRVDVDAAVAMAQSYASPFGAFTETNWAHERAGLNLAIPDNSATGVTDMQAVNTDIKVESVQLQIWITHPNIADLALELISPNGTKSIVINLNNALRGIANYEGEVFLTNAFYRESSQGVWQLKVIDGKSTNTGTLTRWKLNFTGSN